MPHLLLLILYSYLFQNLYLYLWLLSLHNLPLRRVIPKASERKLLARSLPKIRKLTALPC